MVDVNCVSLVYVGVGYCISTGAVVSSEAYYDKLCVLKWIDANKNIDKKCNEGGKWVYSVCILKNYEEKNYEE